MAACISGIDASTTSKGAGGAAGGGALQEESATADEMATANVVLNWLTRTGPPWPDPGNHTGRAHLPYSTRLGVSVK